MAEQPGSQGEERRSAGESWVLRGVYGATYITLGVAFLWYVFATDDRPRLDDAAFKFAILLILLAVFPWASSIKVLDALEIKKGVSQVREEVSALRMHVAALSSSTASSLSQTTINVSAAAAEANETKARLEQAIPNAGETIAETAERYGGRLSHDRGDIVSLSARIEDIAARLYEQETKKHPRALPLTLGELRERGIIDNTTVHAVYDFRGFRNAAVHDPTFSPSKEELESFVELAMAIIARLEMQMQETSADTPDE